MDISKITKLLEKAPSYRLKQVKKAIFQDLIENWAEATTLPKDLRQKLEDCCPLMKLKPEQILTSKDAETIKTLFILEDGFKIESVLMKHGSTGSPQANRRTVCVSSQVGCAMACQFCATGKPGFKRNLLSSEIVEQVLYFARLLKKSQERITNVVFMGMGEPFLNYDNVLGAIKIFNDKDGFNLGSRHISISTCGVTEGIGKLAKEPLQVNLAVSLNAPNNELRETLMPINKKYPIEKILTAVNDYVKKTKRRVMFEYLMIEGVNDSPVYAAELAKLLKRNLYFVNLISFNPTGHSKFKPSASQAAMRRGKKRFFSSPGWKIKEFKEILEKFGITVTQRYRFGREIKAACGQLAGKN